LNEKSTITHDIELYNDFNNRRVTVARMKKKIFISYSRKDIGFKDELVNHLNILSLFDITDNWSCEDITIGNWDNQIQKELDESNVIIYMLSANFFSSSYILEKEVQNVMIGKRNKKSILCVIVSDFIGLDKIENYLRNWQISEKQKAILMLKDFQYLPYGKEWNDITKQHEKKIKSLKDFSNDSNIEAALKQISEKILQLLEKEQLMAEYQQKIYEYQVNEMPKSWNEIAKMYNEFLLEK